MPIITFAYSALEAHLASGARRPVPDRPSVLEALGELGLAVEGAPDGADLSVEALMNRPDLFSVEGVARALRPFLRLSASPEYAVKHGPIAVIVDPSVADIRPAISCAVARGVELDAAGLRRLLDTQEKLDLTYGRRRTRVSIGLHDLAPLSPPITYSAVAPDAASFVPLFGEEMPGGARSSTLREILEAHPKGREFGAILAGKPRYPLLADAKGHVLSMPPIINGTLTELKPGKRDIFIDVTGTARAPVESASRLLAMLLAERGASIESVEVRRPGSPPAIEPLLSPTTHRLTVGECSGLVGVPLRADEVAMALERTGHRASIVPGGQAVDVSSPPWRFDLLHAVDLIEDVAVGTGYRNVAGRMPRAPTLGAEAPLASLARRARTALTGLGFLEVMTLTLTSAENAFEPGAAAPHGLATVANPITRDHAVLRTRLLPSLLSVLAANTNRDLPQALFEVADVVVGGRNEARLAGAYIGSDASFTRAKGIVEAIAQAVGLPFEIAAAHEPPYTRGRCAALMVTGTGAGHFGEVAPAVLDRFALAHPSIAFEFSLARLAAPLPSP